ncbi:MAG: hypothetical protein EOM68_03355 [Spirochaetia bacterium]|nr:hypothetical protein [Spirochaetia bacterium]
MKLKKEDNDRDNDTRKDDKDDHQYWQGPSKDGKKPSLMPQNNPKNRFALMVFITLAITFAYMFFNSATTADQAVPYTTFIAYVNSGEVTSVEIKEQSQINFVLRNGVTAKTRIPYFDDSLLETLKAKKVSVTGSVQEISLLQILLQLL